jgi:arylamine N-acetyltransferase
MDFRPARATVADFQARHQYLSTSPESAFVRTCAVQRRDAGGVDMLTGCVLSRPGDPARERQTIETRREWFEVLGDVFDLPLRDLDATPVQPAVVIRAKWFYGQGLEPEVGPGYRTLVTEPYWQIVAACGPAPQKEP